MKRNGGINEGTLNTLFVASLVLFIGLITHQVRFVPPEPDLNIEPGNNTLLNQRVLAECSRADMGLAQVTVMMLLDEGAPSDVALGADTAIILVADDSSERARHLLTNWRNQFPSMKRLRMLDAELYGIAK